MSDPRLKNIWDSAWQPPDRRPPWQWAEENILVIPHSPQSGRFRSAASPWIREPLECIADPRVNVISIIAGIQSTKTLFAEIAQAWKAVNDPGPTLMLQQRDADARDYNATRFRPFMEAIPAVKRLFHHDRHKIKLESFTFVNGATTWFLGAENIRNLQSRTIKTVFGDETWTWPPGHMTEAEARVSSYGFNAQVIFYSQAGVVGDDTDKKFETTDKREWHYRCPHCAEYFPFDWDRVSCDDEAATARGEYDYNVVRATTVYHSPCGHEFSDSTRNRKAMNLHGRYFATNPNAVIGNVGFHWNQLCCVSWGLLKELELRAKHAMRRGDIGPMRQFEQKRLARSWGGAAISEAKLKTAKYSPADNWPLEGIIYRKSIRHRPVLGADPNEEERAMLDAIISGSIPLRALTVDCQMDHFFAVARAWAPRGDSRLLDWRGGKEGEKSLFSYDDIEVMAEEWGISPGLIFLDNGNDTHNVNLECARRGWRALMGSGRPSFVHRVMKRDRKGKNRRVAMDRYYSPWRPVAFSPVLAAQTALWSNLNIKDMLARLMLNEEGAPSWEVYDTVEAEYKKQMESEARTVDENGVASWDRLGKRANHLWDCEAMQIVVASMMGLVGAEIPKEDESKN